MRWLSPVSRSTVSPQTALHVAGLPFAPRHAFAKGGRSLTYPGIEETNGGLVVFGGGLPLYYDGKLIGAIGVSGGTVPQDEEVAAAGVAGLPAPL